MFRIIVWTNTLKLIKTKSVKRALLALIILLAVLCVVVGKTIPIYKVSRPNIVLISIETTRADHLSCYGYERKTSPTIDKLAKEGVLFSNMFVQRGSTWPSLTSIMTSLYPVNHGVRENGHLLSPSVVSLAEILKENGYKCGAFLATAHNAIWEGFDYKFDVKRNDVKITRRAIKWLRKNSEKRFFLWLHYLQPHKPYQPPKPYDSIFDPNYTGKMDGSREQMDKITLNKVKLNKADLNHIISLYDGAILFVDDRIKQLLSALKALGIEENSLIIVTADHGEDLYQHNFYFYHGASVYDSALHVPFIIKLPGRIPKNTQINEIVESIDIAPTILELLRIPIPGYFEGKSLVSLIFAKNKNNDFLYAYSELSDKVLTIRTDKHRYIFNPTKHHPKRIKGATEDTYPIEKEGLYDIEEDPRESNNIATVNPNIAQKLMKKLSEWDNFERWCANKQKDRKIPEEIKQHLRSLGYVQ